MGIKTKDMPRKQDENKLAQQDEISNSILNNMTNDVDTSSVNTRLKEELIDLEKLFKHRQDRLLRALRDRYRYDISVKHSQDFLFKREGKRTCTEICR